MHWVIVGGIGVVALVWMLADPRYTGPLPIIAAISAIFLGVSALLDRD